MSKGISFFDKIRYNCNKEVKSDLTNTTYEKCNKKYDKDKAGVLFEAAVNGINEANDTNDK